MPPLNNNDTYLNASRTNGTRRHRLVLYDANYVIHHHLNNNPPPTIPRKRTCRKVAARVGHRLLLIEHRVGLHLIRGAGGQLLQIVRQRIVLDGDRAIHSRIR